MDIKREIIGCLKKHTKLKEINLEVPPDNKLGDYAFPCFELGKKLKKNPKKISEELSKKIKIKSVKEIKVAGPYLNFFIDKQKLSVRLIKEILKKKEKYGKSKNKKEHILIEFISPNTNKSLHLGHLRNGILGRSLKNILLFNGFKVSACCLNNDRGVGITEAIVGYKLFHDGEKPGEIKPDHFVAQCYVDYKKAETKESKEKVQELVLKWEKGDKKTIALWKKMVSWVLKGYEETYETLGIDFDKKYYESKIYNGGKDIVLKGFKKGIFIEENGAIIARLKKYNLPNKVLIKSDGTSLYMTQDIHLAKLKEKDFKMDKSIYVVGSEHDTHFRQLFKILELLNFKFAEKCHHLSYGLVMLPSGRMKSREGKVVDADDIIEEVIELAKKEVKKRNKNISKREIGKRSKIIGLGAINFFMFKFDNKTSFTFDPDKSLSFEGETGPYIQYTYARICSVLKKYGKSVSLSFKPEFLNSMEEEKIIGLLGKYEDVVVKAGEEYKPSLIARYLLDLSQSFNEFYHNQNILKSDRNVKIARLNLIKAVREILKNGLGLLGIDVLESM